MIKCYRNHHHPHHRYHLVHCSFFPVTITIAIAITVVIPITIITNMSIVITITMATTITMVVTVVTPSPSLSPKPSKNITIIVTNIIAIAIGIIASMANGIIPVLYHRHDHLTRHHNCNKISNLSSCEKEPDGKA